MTRKVPAGRPQVRRSIARRSEPDPSRRPGPSGDPAHRSFSSPRRAKALRTSSPKVSLIRGRKSGTARFSSKSGALTPGSRSPVSGSSTGCAVSSPWWRRPRTSIPALADRVLSQGERLSVHWLVSRLKEDGDPGSGRRGGPSRAHHRQRLRGLLHPVRPLSAPRAPRTRTTSCARRPSRRDGVFRS